MDKPTFYHIADIIQRHRTWIKVIDTERFIPMRIVQQGKLRSLLFQAITLQSYRARYGFQRRRIWNINESDIGHALATLIEADPTAKLRAELQTLTMEDVEFIIERASFGIIKLELYNYDS